MKILDIGLSFRTFFFTSLIMPYLAAAAPETKFGPPVLERAHFGDVVVTNGIDLFRFFQ